MKKNKFLVKKVSVIVLIITMAIITFQIVPEKTVAAETGSGSSEIYYNITYKTTTDYSVGDEVMLSTMNNLGNANYVGFTLPDNMDARGTISNQITGSWSTTLSPVYGFELSLRSKQMDEHNGWIGWKGSTWLYHCTGNSDRGEYYAYTVQKSTFTPSDVTVSENSTLSGTVGKDDITVTIAVPGKTLTLANADFSFSDSTLDPASGDCTYKLNINGVSITKFDSGRADKVIDDVVGLTEAQKNAYKDQLDSATTDAQVKMIVDKATAKGAVENVDGLTTAQKDAYKAQIDSATTSDQLDAIVAKATAKGAVENVDGLTNAQKDAYKTEIDSATTSAQLDAIVARATAKGAANEAVDNVDGLTNAQKDAYKTEIDSDTTGDQLDAIVARATAKGAANLEANNNAKPAINSLLKTNKEKINNLRNLSSNKKLALCNELDNEANTIKNNMDLAANVSEVNTLRTNGIVTINDVLENATADDFIIGFLAGPNSSIFNIVKSSNVDQILRGQTPWNNLPADVQSNVNTKIAAKNINGIASYEDFILRTNSFVNERSKLFVQNYLQKENIINKKATSNNYKQILRGEKIWKEMSEAEKDAINEILIEAGGMTYEDLLYDAEEIKADIEAAKTGDSFSLWIWLSLLLISGSIGALLIGKRKRNHCV